MSSSFECPVCFESNKDTIVSTLPCRHHICLKCTLTLNPSLCPLCRKDYTSAIDIIKYFGDKDWELVTNLHEWLFVPKNGSYQNNGVAIIFTLKIVLNK